MCTVYFGLTRLYCVEIANLQVMMSILEGDRHDKNERSTGNFLALKLSRTSSHHDWFAHAVLHGICTVVVKALKGCFHVVVTFGLVSYLFVYHGCTLHTRTPMHKLPIFKTARFTGIPQLPTL